MINNKILLYNCLLAGILTKRAKNIASCFSLLLMNGKHT